MAPVFQTPTRVINPVLLIALAEAGQKRPANIGPASALGNLTAAEVPGVLVAKWKHHGPTLRQQVLDVLLSRPAWTDKLLTRIEQQPEFAAAIGTAHRQRLLTHDDEKLRGRANTVFGAAKATDRQELVEKYRNVIDMKGDPQRGQEVFQRRCAVCHRLTGPGINVGPDLRALTDRSAESLLIALLDPNRAVEAKEVQNNNLPNLRI